MIMFQKILLLLILISSSSALAFVSQKCLDQFNLVLAGQSSDSSPIPVECQYYKMSDLDPGLQKKVRSQIHSDVDTKADFKLSSILATLKSANKAPPASVEEIQKNKASPVQDTLEDAPTSTEDISNIPIASKKDMEYCTKPFEALLVHQNAFPLINYEHENEVEICNFLSLKLNDELTNYFVKKYGKYPEEKDHTICKNVLVRDTDAKFKKLYDTLNKRPPRTWYFKDKNPPLEITENLHTVLCRMYSKALYESDQCNWKDAADNKFPKMEWQQFEKYKKEHRNPILKFTD